MKMLHRILSYSFLSVAAIQRSADWHYRSSQRRFGCCHLERRGRSQASRRSYVSAQRPTSSEPTSSRRLPLAITSVTVSAPGFSTVETKVSMLVGQTPEVDVILPMRGTSDAVIVRADETAVDTTSSTVAGNITPDDVKNLPINGRNYMELATLVPGVRVNAIANDTPLGGANSGKFQINLDGLQVTQNTADASFGQPRFSPDAIIQFQIITNRFDATAGSLCPASTSTSSPRPARTRSTVLPSATFATTLSTPLTRYSKTQGNPTPITPLSDQQYRGYLRWPDPQGKALVFRLLRR